MKEDGFEFIDQQKIKFKKNISLQLIVGLVLILAYSLYCFKIGIIDIVSHFKSCVYFIGIYLIIITIATDYLTRKWHSQKLIDQKLITELKIYDDKVYIKTINNNDFTYNKISDRLIYTNRDNFRVMYFFTKKRYTYYQKSIVESIFKIEIEKVTFYLVPSYFNDPEKMLTDFLNLNASVEKGVVEGRV